MSPEMETDQQLLKRGGDAAYEELIRRHGRQVFNVCRRGLGDSQDAEDTAQAAFLALAHHAHSIKDVSVAGWLHRVAWNLTLNARRAAATRREREREAATMKERSKGGENRWPEIEELLDGELDALPEKFRLPVIIHLIEGESIEDGAQRLGWNSGTFASRLWRGKELLREKLVRRGVTLSVTLLATLIGEHAVSAPLPAQFAAKTAHAASLTATGASASMSTAPEIAHVIGQMKTGSLAKLKLAAVAFVILGIFCSAALAVYHTRNTQPLTPANAGVVPVVSVEQPRALAETGSKSSEKKDVAQAAPPATTVDRSEPAHAPAAAPLAVDPPRPPAEPEVPAEARSKLAGLNELLNEIAPVYGPVRPPYDLARHDLSLTTGKLAELSQQACDRQTRLEKAWSELQKESAGKTLSDIEAAHMALLKYAFGSGTVEPALTAARKAGGMEQLRVARLLLSECQFNAAVDELMSLAKETGKAADLAQALLVQHALERRAIKSRVSLVPLKVDLNAYLEKCKKDERWLGFIETIEKSVRAKLPPESFSMDTPATDIVVPPDILAHAELGDHFEGVWGEAKVNDATLSDVFLETFNSELTLFPDSKATGYVTGNGTTLTLHTAYHGPLAFKLYYYEKEADWKAIGPGAIANAEPDRKWEKTFHPLRANNRQLAIDQELSVDNLRNGYYLLTVEARYSPWISGLKFAVSNTALYLRAARNQVTAAAVDRATGKPVAGFPLEVTIDGNPVLPPYPQEIVSEEEQKAFRTGFFKEELPPPSATGISEQYIIQARACALGRAARQKIHDFNRSLSGKTAADGCWNAPVDLSDRSYTYKVLARSTGAAPAETEISYSENPEQPKTKILAWAGQPIYRPGDTAQFKGVIRSFDRLQAAPYSRLKKDSVAVEIKNTNGTLWKGTCELSPAGSFNSEFKIPVHANFGGYSVFIDGEEAAPRTVFEIQEFRLPTFQLDATMAQNNYAGGQTADGKVHVSYFSGKPVVGTPVEIVLETGELEPPTVTANTDETGNANFHLPVPALPEQRWLTVRATAVDASGQSYTQTAGFTAQPTAFYLEAKCIPEVVNAGDPADIEVKAIDWQGKPVSGLQVTAEGFPKAARTGADGKAILTVKTQWYASNQQFKICSLGEQVAWCNASVALKPRDAKTTAAEGHRDYLLLTPVVNPGRGNEIDAGQPLKLSINADNQDGHDCFVLLFADNTRALDQRALHLSPGIHEIEIPTNSDFAPQCHIEAVLLTGTKIMTQRSNVFVRPVQRMLTVEVSTAKQEYRPAEKCVAEILVLDNAKRPVANAEVSLGVVQSPIFEIREDPTPDLQAYFYHYDLPDYAQSHYDYNGPALYDTLSFSKGPKYTWGSSTLFGTGTGHGSFGYRSGGGRRLLVKRHGGSKLTTSDADARMRENFRTTAHWVANLVTDANGKATAEFSFPDDITEWRFTARSLTAETLVGEVRVKRQTLLPLQSELILPRALRDGDRVRVSAMIHENANVARTVTANGTCGGTTVAKELALKAHDAVRLEIPVEPTSTGELRLTASTKDAATGDSDASARNMPVLPRGHHVAANFCGMAKDGGSIPLELGATLRAGSVKATITLEPGFGGVVSSAVGKLIEYPYGCVEQTMSRFMPAAIAGKALKQAKLPNPNEKKLEAVFAQSINKIAGYQHSDGGWGWWQNDRTNDYMTAYVLEGLTLCAGAGHSIPQEMFKRAEHYLSERLRSDSLDGTFRLVHSTPQYSIQIYAAHALAMYYALDTKANAAQLQQLQQFVTDHDLAGQAKENERDRILSADTLRLLGKRDEAANALAEVTKSFRVSGDRSSLLTAATLLETGRLTDPENPRWVSLARDLIARRKGAGWTDTQISAAVVRGLSSFLNGGPAPTGGVNLFADGNPAGTLSLQGDQQSIALSKEIVGAKSVTFKNVGDVGDCFWSARVEGYRINPADAPAKPDVTLNCRVFEGENEIVAENDMLKVKPAKTYKVRFEFDLKEAVNCARITFPRPCGVELVGASQLKKQNIVAMEDHDDSAHFFIDAWEAGKHSIEFFVRAEVEGEVFAPLPEFEPMYGDALSVDVHSPTQWIIAK